MPETYGYVRPRVSELSGSDPETQRQQLLAAGVALSHIYQDVGVSGTSGTNSRRGWHSLDTRLAQGDTLVIDGGHYVLLPACCRSVGSPGLLDGFPVALRIGFWELTRRFHRMGSAP
jgi:hypothetical protein